jgi:hypothetical protein
MPLRKPQIFSASAPCPAARRASAAACHPGDHIAAGFEELRLSGVWLDASVTELLGNTLDALTEISGIAPERCAMDAVLETRQGLAPHCTLGRVGGDPVRAQVLCEESAPLSQCGFPDVETLPISRGSSGATGSAMSSISALASICSTNRLSRADSERLWRAAAAAKRCFASLLIQVDRCVLPAIGQHLKRGNDALQID